MLSEDWLIYWGLTALLAHIGYIVPSLSLLQLKIEINENVENVKRREYVK